MTHDAEHSCRTRKGSPGLPFLFHPSENKVHPMSNTAYACSASARSLRRFLTGACALAALSGGAVWAQTDPVEIVVGAPEGSAPAPVGAPLEGIVNLGADGRLIFNHNEDYRIGEDVQIQGSGSAYRIDFLSGRTTITQRAPELGDEPLPGFDPPYYPATNYRANISGGLATVGDGATVHFDQHYQMSSGSGEQTDRFPSSLLTMVIEDGGLVTGRAGFSTLTVAGTLSPDGDPERTGRYDGHTGLIYVQNEARFTSGSVFEIDLDPGASDLDTDRIRVNSGNLIIEDGARLRVRAPQPEGEALYRLGRRFIYAEMQSARAGYHTHMFMLDADLHPADEAQPPLTSIQIAAGEIDPPNPGDSIVIDGFTFNYLMDVNVAGREVQGEFEFADESDRRLTRFLGLEPGVGQINASAGATDLDLWQVIRVPVNATLYLEVVMLSDLAEEADTVNGRSAAHALQAVGVQNELFNQVVNLAEDDPRLTELPGFFDALSGELHVGVRGLLSQEAYQLQRSIGRRLDQAERDGVRIWMEALGGRRELSGGEAAALEETGYGALFGIDAPVAGAWRVGAAGGYRTADIDGPDMMTGQAELTQWHGAVYTASARGRWRAQAGLGISGASVDTSRTIALSGILDDRLGASYDATVLHAFGELGYAAAVAGGEVQPFLNLSVIQAEADEVRETGLNGSSQADLTITGDDTLVQYATLGVKGRTLDLGDLSLDGMIGWRRGFGDTRLTGRHLLNNREGFAVSGADLGENAAVIEAGLSWRATGALTLGLSYGGVISGDNDDHSVQGGVSLRF